MLHKNCAKWPLATSVDSRGVAVGRRTSASGAVRKTAWPIEALGKRASMVCRALFFPEGPESAISETTAGRLEERANLKKPS